MAGVDVMFSVTTGNSQRHSAHASWCHWCVCVCVCVLVCVRVCVYCVWACGSKYCEMTCIQGRKYACVYGDKAPLTLPHDTKMCGVSEMITCMQTYVGSSEYKRTRDKELVQHHFPFTATNVAL